MTKVLNAHLPNFMEIQKLALILCLLLLMEPDSSNCDFACLDHPALSVALGDVINVCSWLPGRALPRHSRFLSLVSSGGKRTGWRMENRKREIRAV